MIAGQVQDLENENKTVSVDDLRSVDVLKTGELIRCACQLGCIAAGADDKKLEAARVYAENLGIAFQIVALLCTQPAKHQLINHRGAYLLD